MPFDWRLLEGLDLKIPYMVSGGLDASNVAEAVRVTRAPGVAAGAFDMRNGSSIQAPGADGQLLVNASSFDLNGVTLGGGKPRSLASTPGADTVRDVSRATV